MVHTGRQGAVASSKLCLVGRSKIQRPCTMCRCRCRCGMRNRRQEDRPQQESSETDRQASRPQRGGSCSGGAGFNRACNIGVCTSPFRRMFTVPNKANKKAATHPQIIPIYRGRPRDRSFSAEVDLHCRLQRQRSMAGSRARGRSFPAEVDLPLRSSTVFCKVFCTAVYRPACHSGARDLETWNCRAFAASRTKRH
jgi:hypothetical protein